MTVDPQHASRMLVSTAVGAGASVALWLWWRGRNTAGSVEADYRSWLNVPAAETALVERNSAVFGTFLRNSGPKVDSAATSSPAPALGPPPSQGQAFGERDVELLVMFGTEYGFSKEVAEHVACELTFSPYRCKIVDMADHPEGYPLANEQVALMVCSTQGDGVPPSEARPFVEWLDGAPPLQKLNFSVLALGDRSYTHFAACGKRIDASMEKLGAARLHPRVDVHMEDWAAIQAWTEGVKQALASLDLSPTRSLGIPVAREAAAPTIKRRYGRSNPYFAKVTQVQGLCKLQHPGDKDTVQIELDLNTAASGLKYVPGDVLGVMPVNPRQGVVEILEYIGLPEDYMVPAPSWHYDNDQGSQIPLGSALRLCYDLRSPRPALLKELCRVMEQQPPRGGAEAAKLREIVGSLEKQGQTPAEIYLSERHVTDILEDFPSAKLPLATLLACLRPLQPRLYSISSSPLESEGRVQVTVAVVRYRTLNKDRVGVASTYLGESTQVGDTVAVYTSKNPDFRLPPSPETPIIMVGPGTGLAPFRAFVQHRLLSASEARAPPGEAVLFFGCRRRDQDFLYRDLLEGWHETGAIQLRTAFSRETSNKVYVQHRLREEGGAVWRLLEAGAHFYVCGDAQYMAGDVEAALLDIVAEHQKRGAEAAAAYLDNLRAADRYQRDVWF